MLNDDIVTAQKILGNSFKNLRKENYHFNSFIYKNTNEKISNYKQYLENKKKILSVISSGDQILNSILLGSLNIDAFDISRFPKYFLELKIAAIKTLSRDEYINFFMGLENKDEFNEEAYDYISENLKGDYLKFWNSLFNFFDGCDIYHSSLFSNEVFSIATQINNNLYLSEDNYRKLKNKFNDVLINYYIGNIDSLISNLNNSYDLVNLSSIIYYGKMNNYEYYKSFLNRLNLSSDGIALTYLYDINKDILNNFSDLCFNIDTFNDGGGVLIYKRKK